MQSLRSRSFLWGFCFKPFLTAFTISYFFLLFYKYFEIWVTTLDVYTVSHATIPVCSCCWYCCRGGFQMNVQHKCSLVNLVELCGYASADKYARAHKCTYICSYLYIKYVFIEVYLYISFAWKSCCLVTAP